jgi:hypothetical protein
MRLSHLVALAAGLALSAPALASDADPNPATCKDIAAAQFGVAAVQLTSSGLVLAFEPEDEEGLALQAKARKLRERATGLGYALAGEPVPATGEDYFGWHVSRLDTVFANCEKKHAALLQASAPQKWVVLDIGNPGTKLAADMLNIRTVGSRRAINLMLGFAEPFDGGDGRWYGATMDTFTFDCAARGNSIATLQIAFTTEFEQNSLAPGADAYPYGPNSQLAYYERLACGEVVLPADRQSAPDMVSAARMTVELAAR